MSSTTPAKTRTSGIPGPSRVTGIPTPGRSRSSSSTFNTPASQDADYMNKALADAIKANDPAQHQSAPGPSSAKLSPPSLSGRRSVTGRSISVSSNASSVTPTYPRERTKTPVSSRPLSRSSSRQSDVFSKTMSRSFVVGDNVRIDSLGFEGVLRYLGEIEGKPGQWAGVELNGGFQGKGKNNGVVDGKQYFSCPEKCGVFVSAIKLSSSAPRPPSAATRNGRVTPATLNGQFNSASLFGPRPSLPDGRITPSASTSTSGRITPSLSSGSVGRITPGMTPASRTGQIMNKSFSQLDSPSLNDKITAGSRASKYMGMTAKQLNSRQFAPESPSHRSLGAASSIRSTASTPNTESPTLPPASPFSTPKLGVSSRSSIGKGLPSPTKGRASLNTPRARVPSAVAMPPPASPMSARSASMDHRNSESVDSDILNRGLASSEGIAFPGNSRPSSAAARRSLVEPDPAMLEQLRSRIQALEYDNERLRNLSEDVEPRQEKSVDHENVVRERDDALSRIAQLQEALDAAERSLKTYQADVDSSRVIYTQNLSALEAEKDTIEKTVTSLRQELHEQNQVLTHLEAQAKEQQALSHDTEARVRAREAETAALNSKLEVVSAAFQVERSELIAQVDELRLAGQETIALYEERLNTADSQRYELESRVSNLETTIAATQNGSAEPLLGSMQGGTSAAEIDNENLREQVLHLQRQISNLEDQLEDAQAASQREEDAFRDRMQRLREKEENMKQELNDGKRETERMVKSEARALSRLEESEEALRESTVALENARAEVENLRSELANLDSLVVNRKGGDLYSRVAELAERASIDQERYQAEIQELKTSLEKSRTEGTRTDELLVLQEANNKLRMSVSDYDERVATLVEQLEARTQELESVRKRGNREIPIHNGLDMSKSTPHSPTRTETNTNREEIMGLKHIVQELQKENSVLSQRIKILESENQLLKSEADQLRQEVQILEDSVEKSLMDAEREMSQGVNDSPPRRLKEQRSELEVERDQLQKRLAEAEMKSARTIHDLNKEISELEALIESKIYREDELEQEIERLKEKLARHRKAKGSTDTVDARRTSKNTTASDVAVCEICERPGHDIFNCDVLNKPDNATTTTTTTTTPPTANLFCQDCESYGHEAKDCPHSMDVF